MNFSLTKRDTALTIQALRVAAGRYAAHSLAMMDSGDSRLAHAFEYRRLAVLRIARYLEQVK